MVVDPVAVGRDERGAEREVGKELVGDGQAHDVGAALDLGGGVARIDELPRQRLLAVFEKGIKAGRLHIDRRGEAQLDELAAANAARERGAKALSEGFNDDLDPLAIDQGGVKVGDCGGFNCDPVEAVLGRCGPQEIGKQGPLAGRDLEGEHLADHLGSQRVAEVDGQPVEAGCLRGAVGHQAHIEFHKAARRRGQKGRARSAIEIAIGAPVGPSDARSVDFTLETRD